MLVLFLMFFGTTAMFGKDFIVTDKDNKVLWTAVGQPSFLKINAEGGKVTGVGDITDGVVKGSFKVDLSAFDTGMDLRNKHMKEKYLETSKFPAAILDLKPAKITDGKFQGMLGIKGQSKPVSGTFSVKGDQVEAKFRVNIKDYPDIGVPSYLGITVSDYVNVSVQFRYQ